MGFLPLKLLKKPFELKQKYRSKTLNADFRLHLTAQKKHHKQVITKFYIVRV